MAYTEAHKRAAEKWNNNNKEQMNYLKNRSSCKSFIKNKATLEDLVELEKLLEDKRKELNR
jgi:hypothetical protein